MKINIVNTAMGSQQQNLLEEQFDVHALILCREGTKENFERTLKLRPEGCRC
jgi:hypothetical protein